MSIVLVSDIELVAGEEEVALAALREVCEQTHAKDEGCLVYALHRDVNDPTHVMMIEKWESMDAVRKHGSSDHVRATGRARGFARKQVLTTLEPLGFGDERLGML